MDELSMQINAKGANVAFGVAQRNAPLLAKRNANASGSANFVIVGVERRFR